MSVHCVAWPGRLASRKKSWTQRGRRQRSARLSPAAAASFNPRSRQFQPRTAGINGSACSKPTRYAASGRTAPEDASARALEYLATSTECAQISGTARWRVWPVTGCRAAAFRQACNPRLDMQSSMRDGRSLLSPYSWAAKRRIWSVAPGSLNTSCDISWRSTESSCAFSSIDSRVSGNTGTSGRSSTSSG